MDKLYRQWGVLTAIAAIFWSTGILVLRLVWTPLQTIGWAAISGGLLALQLINLYRHLDENRAVGEALRTTLGTANWMSSLRGILAAGVAGFVAGPRLEGWPGWLPGIFFLCSILMDYADGAIARKFGKETRLGERLDMSLDGLAVLAGSLLLVLYGQAPVWYLLVGLARYLFLFGERLRKQRGLIIHPLPPSPYRRAIAGAQMGFIAGALFPVFHPPFTVAAASLFMVPFLVGFWLDWLSITGRRGTADRSAFEVKSIHRSRTGDWIVLAIRVSAAGTGAVVAFNTADSQLLLAALMLLCALAVFLGAAGRAAALMLMLASGVMIQFYPFQALPWLLLVFSLGVFYTGTGRWSLWKPEEWLIYHRAGEARQP